MSGADTTLGGSRESFPNTTWASLFSPAMAPARRREQLTRLCSLYWRPVYRFIRLAGRPIEDAKDLCQEFFSRLMEDDFLDRYKPERGPFRHFLKAALRNFLHKAHRDATTAKRGGGRRVVSLDAEGFEATQRVEDPRGATPDELFDRQWAGDLMARALEELQRLLTAEGRADHFDLYRAYALVAPDVRPTYEALAAGLGIAAHDVANRLRVVRGRLQAILMAAITDYVTSPDEVAQELKTLFLDGPS